MHTQMMLATFAISSQIKGRETNCATANPIASKSIPFYSFIFMFALYDIFSLFLCHIKHFSVLRLYSQFARNKSNSTTVNFQNGYILIFCRYDNVSSKLDELFAGVRFAVFADFICLALAVANIFMAPHIRHCIEIDFRLKATFVTDVCFYSFILSLGRSVVRLLVLLAWMFCSRCHSPSERCLIFHLLFVKLNKFILN